MYNRYIPSGDGGFIRRRVEEAREPGPEAAPGLPASGAVRQPTADDLPALALLWLLTGENGGREERLTFLLAAAAYFIL